LNSQLPPLAEWSATSARRAGNGAETSGGTASKNITGRYILSLPTGGREGEEGGSFEARTPLLSEAARSKRAFSLSPSFSFSF